MASNKRLIAAGASAAAFDPLQNFETVTYTGNGGTQKITGYIRKGAAFNGSSSKILIGEFAGLNTSDYSVSLWFNHDSTDTSTNNRRLIQLNCTSGGDAGLFDMMFKQSTFEFTLRSGSGGTNILTYTSNATELPDDTWNHIAVTRDSTSNLTILYINGTKVKEQTQNESTTFGAFSAIGCRGNGDLQILGKIDQVRIFNEELDETTDGRITALYNENYDSPTKSTTDIFGNGSGIALYELDGDANDTGGSFGSLVSSSKINLDVDGYTSGSVSDLSGNGNTATVTGATYGTDPNGGGYFELDGSSDYLQISASTDFNSATDFTIEGWFNPNNLTAVDHLFSIYGGASDRKFYLRLNNTSGDLQWQTYNSNGVNAGYFNTSNINARLTASQWNHVAVTHINNGTMEVFVDGVSAGTGTSTGINTSGTEDLYIGVLNSYIGSYDFDGKVGQFRFYDSALTSSQVVQNFNASKGEYGVGLDGTPTNVNFLGMAFAPDLVWVKSRDTTGYHHELYDSIRGDNKRIFTSQTDQELTGYLQLTSNGFNLSSGGGAANISNDSYVAWCWKAGGAAVSNTDGDITSQVSANTEAGFSIVEWTSNGSSSQQTKGHGLSSAPELIIIKNTDLSDNWFVYSSTIGNAGYVRLNTYDAAITGTTINWLSSTTTFGHRENSIALNNNVCIAYCFHSVDGFSSIGTYQGNGAAVGNKTTLDFEPRWLMVKRTNNISQWSIFDSTRSPSNARDEILWANLSNSEQTKAGDGIDFLSDGFQPNGTTSSDVNASSSTYLYIAFA